MTGSPLPATDRLDQALASWLPGRRWFAGKGRAFSPPRVVHRVALPDDGARAPWRAELLVVEVRHSQVEAPEHYLVPVGTRRDLPEHLEPFAIARYDDGVVYDALADPDIVLRMARELLSSSPGGHPPLAVHGHGNLTAVERAAALDAGPGTVRAIPGEQSNTSVVVGDTVLVKVFRRLRAGENPESELLGLLTAAGETRVPHLLAALDGPLAGGRATYAVAQRYLPGATSGWDLALEDAEDLAHPAGATAAAARRGRSRAALHMGRAVAGVHRSLAEAAPTALLTRDDLREIGAGMRERLAAAERAVPRLQALAPRITAAYEDLERAGQGVPAQRLHGDLHLGQMLHTASGWSVIDFEGEPDRTFTDRRRLHPVAKDVAGVLRSFDYAAQHLLLSRQSAGEPAGEDVRQALSRWTRRSQRAFCAGYAEAAGSDPRDRQEILRAYLMDKAVYELLYEVRSRPRWAPIPMRALQRLVHEASVPLPNR